MVITLALEEQVSFHFCKDGHLPTCKNYPHYVKEQELLNQATEQNMKLSKYKTAVKQEKEEKAVNSLDFLSFHNK